MCMVTPSYVRFAVTFSLFALIMMCLDAGVQIVFNKLIYDHEWYMGQCLSLQLFVFFSVEACAGHIRHHPHL